MSPKRTVLSAENVRPRDLEKGRGDFFKSFAANIEQLKAIRLSGGAVDRGGGREDTISSKRNH